MNKHKNTPENLRVPLGDREPFCASEERELKALAMNEDPLGQHA